MNTEVGVIHDYALRELRLFTDYGRTSRPLFIVEEGNTLAFKRQHLESLLNKYGGPDVLCCCFRAFAALDGKTSCCLDCCAGRRVHVWTCSWAFMALWPLSAASRAVACAGWCALQGVAPGAPDAAAAVGAWDQRAVALGPKHLQ